MKLLTLGALLSAALLFAGCAHKAPVASQKFCDFKRHSLEVGDPSTSLAGLIMSAPDTYKAARAHPAAPLLFLSGGSQHGAFGAGFLKGWAASRPEKALPPFSVVTGVSTGAILGTFAFINDTERTWNAYRLLREDQILEVYNKRVQKTNVGIRGGVTAVRRGAIADLVPFRALMTDNLPDEVIEKVAVEGRDPHGRRFYVAAVNLDTGQAEVFDMTNMAVKISSATTAEDKGFYRDCYVEAIAASSSVPFAAKPVFIDNRMYIDGGARFAIFSHELGPVLPSGFLPHTRVYMLFNGDAKMTPRCGKLDEAHCRSPQEPASKQGAHADWSFPGLAFRTVDILQNQVARLSVARAEQEGASTGGLVKFKRIEEDKDDFKFTMDEPKLGSGEKSCKEWRQVDEQQDRPFEFHPRYMRCLVAYGEAKGKAAGWTTEFPGSRR